MQVFELSAGVETAADDSAQQSRLCLVCNERMSRPLDWLYRCPSCRFEQSTLLPGAGRGIEGLETLRRKNFRTIISVLRGLRPLKGLKCLEVGCAEGWFIEEMRETGALTSAIEASDQALDLQRRGVDVIHGFFPQVLPDEARFDLIVFNDVFEHLPDPVAAIGKCEHHLNDDGLLVMNLPNRRGFFYRTATALSRIGVRGPLARMWQKGFASPHLTYFSDDILERFVSRNTSLRRVSRFYLPSIVRDGLEQRIGASHGKLASKVMSLGIGVLMPFIKTMPQDIMVFVFRKPAAHPMP